jgi:glycosidase
MLWGGDQDQDLLAHFQHLGRMRAESVALRRGAIRTVLADHEVFVYERSADDERVTVALNFSESPQSREVNGVTFELGPLGSEVKRTGLVESQA